MERKKYRKVEMCYFNIIYAVERSVQILPIYIFLRTIYKKNITYFKHIILYKSNTYYIYITFLVRTTFFFCIRILIRRLVFFNFRFVDVNVYTRSTLLHNLHNILTNNLIISIVLCLLQNIKRF